MGNRKPRLIEHKQEESDSMTAGAMVISFDFELAWGLRTSLADHSPYHGIERDIGNVGVTLHRVDEGIDTGGIIRQARIDFDPARDNILTLNAKQNIAGVAILTEWLKVGAPNVTIDPAPGASRLYFSPGLREYLQFEKFARQDR